MNKQGESNENNFRNSEQSQRASSQQVIFNKANSEQVDKYKKKLLVSVIGITSILLLLIVERIFYEIFVDWEISLLRDAQQGMNLLEEMKINEQVIYPFHFLLLLISNILFIFNGGVQEEEIVFWKFDRNLFWDLFGYIDMFKYNFLLVTAFLGVTFVSIDSLIAVKVGYISIYGYYVMAILTMMYAGGRPFWESEDIGSPVCINTYSHPSSSTFMMLFLIFYTVYCFKRRDLSANKESVEQIEKTYSWIRGGLISLTIILVFLKYIMGQDFIINMFLAVVYFMIYFLTLQFMDGYIDSLIQKSTVYEKSAKKYVFYWFLYLVISESYATVLYSAEDYYAPTEWLQNYIQCMQAAGSLNGEIPFDEMIGPWYTFIQSSCTCGLIGAVFGVAYTYRNTARNFNWYKGSTKNRLLRSLILILSMGPSLVLTIFQGKLVNLKFMQEIGLNEFFLSCFHYFFLYFFLFGMLPRIFEKIGLVDPSEDEGYKVLQTNKDISLVHSNQLGLNQQQSQYISPEANIGQ